MTERIEGRLRFSLICKETVKPFSWTRWSGEVHTPMSRNRVVMNLTHAVLVEDNRSERQ